MTYQRSGYKYDFNVIYNHADSYLTESEDNIISLKFTCFLVNKLNTFGLKSGYYHDRDALPGKNIFSELFRIVSASKWTIVIVSKGFSKNCWSKYSCQSAFKKLIDKDKGENLIPIGLGIDENAFPDMHGIAQKAWFGLNEEQWNSARAAAEWEKVRRLVCPLDVRHHAQESQGLKWTDKKQLVTIDSAVLQEEEEGNLIKRNCRAPASTVVPGATANVQGDSEVFYPRTSSYQVVDSEDAGNDAVDGEVLYHRTSSFQGVGSEDVSNDAVAGDTKVSAGTYAAPINDVDLENRKAMQEKEDSGYSETNVKQVYNDSATPIEDTANDADSLSEEELSDDPDRSEESCENLNNVKEMGLFEIRNNRTAFETSPEESNNNFSNENPGDTATEEASDIPAWGDCTVLGRQLTLSQKAGAKPQEGDVAGTKTLVKESTLSLQPSGGRRPHPDDLASCQDDVDTVGALTNKNIEDKQEKTCKISPDSSDHMETSPEYDDAVRHDSKEEAAAGDNWNKYFIAMTAIVILVAVYYLRGRNH